MIYLCENKDCQCKMEDVFLSMTIEQSSRVVSGKRERREFAFCSTSCFVAFCNAIIYRGSPMAIDGAGNRQYTSIPSSVEYPLAPWT